MADFAKIGLHLDLRVQVPPLPALRRIAADAARGGVNTLIIEWEASFPFDRNAVISSRYAYTPEEIRAFLLHCAELGLDVVPLQQCFGHVEYILRHDRYAALRENESDLSQVCPCRSTEALAVFTDIFRELAAAHTSEFFHIGGDETYLLGSCPECSARALREGKSKLYVDYLKQLAEVVVSMGKRPLLWVDMLLKYPEAAAQMPSQCIFIDWNYGWPVDRFGDFAGLSALPFEFWGAVAMRSAPDNHSSHAWETHLDNIKDYIPVARQMQFGGIVMTSWSTSGIYGYEWEMTGQPLALFPVRRVTPHAGLPLLLQAFSEAVRGNVLQSPGAFLERYGRERFRFDAAEAATFREAILLSDGSASGASDATARLARARGLMASLRPLVHTLEFERYALMIDMAEFNDRVVRLDQLSQSQVYTRSAREDVGRQALAMLKEGEAFEQRFEHLYSGELYPEEFQEESGYRLRRIRNLVEKTRAGREQLAAQQQGKYPDAAGELKLLKTH